MADLPAYTKELHRREPEHRIALVMPSIREASFKRFVDEWSKAGLFKNVHLILVEDNPKKTFEVDRTLVPDCSHYSWEDIDWTFEKDSWIFPRRSDTIRSFGYYWAWSQGHEIIVTLDDDCYPLSREADGAEYANGADTFLMLHMERLAGTANTRWFNTLTSVKPRGVPYQNLGALRSHVNHGLWMNVLDYDAPTQLVAPVPEKFAFDSRVVPTGQYFPMCGMNLAWRREATVLMYHLLMGQKAIVDPASPGAAVPTLEKLPFDRFGDIWAGIFMKKIADILGWRVTTGLPYIHHDRASNPFTNLRKEANGLEVNESLWEYVDQFVPAGALNATPAELYGQLGNHIHIYDEFPEHKEYFQKLGEAMVIWAGLFQEDK